MVLQAPQAPQGRSERCDGVMGSWLHGYSLDSMKIAMLGMSRDMWYDMSLDIPSFPPMAFHIEGFTLFTLLSRRERPSSFTPCCCCCCYSCEMVPISSHSSRSLGSMLWELWRLSWDCLETVLSLSWVSLESLSRIQGFWGYPLGFLGLHNVPHRVSTWYPIGYP